MTSRKLDSDSETPVAREILSDCLIRHAVAKAPPDLAERLEEEWRADMASRPSYLSRLRFALGCCWATQVIAYEHQPSKAAATVASGSGSSILAFSESYGAGFDSRRGSSFLVVVALHAAVFYGLVAWVTGPHAPKLVEALIPTILPKPVSNDHPRPDPPKIPQMRIDDFPPPADVHVEVDPPPVGIDTITYRVGPPIIQTSTSVAHEVRRVLGGAGKGFPNVDEYYPGTEIRMAHQGAAEITVCVNAAGKLESAPTLKATSGFDGLDEAALRLAQAGSGHYRATTEDGQPVSSCYPLRVRFQLKN